MSLKRWKSPPTGPDLPDYHYTRLRGRNSIRLLQLLPGTGNKAIAIDLVDSFICGPDEASYDALSYTWGDGQPNKTIFCNGKRLLVTQTLLEALRHLRDSNRTVTLWVDQLCICQDRVSEKNRQVQLMGTIFKNARKVFVWLGHHSDNSGAGMQLARHLLDISAKHSTLNPEQLEAHGLPKRGSKRWKSLAAILRRPWFYRTWIVQEVVLNSNVEVVIGDTSISWSELERVVSLLEGPNTRQRELDPTMSAWELPFSRINSIRLRHQRHLADQSDRTSAEKLAESNEDLNSSEDERDGCIDLLDLLVMARGLGATDPRDKVYVRIPSSLYSITHIPLTISQALLGLSTSDVAPDYTLSPAMIFQEFAMHILGDVTKLGEKISSFTTEARRVMVLLACARGGRRTSEHRQLDKSAVGLDLPSWVPDWTAPLLSRPFVFDHRFQAGGDTFEVDWDHETGLRLCGKLLDTVETAGTVLLAYIPDETPSSAHTKLEEWWQESQLIARSRSVTSPGSTMNVDAFKGLCRDLVICKHGYHSAECRNPRNTTADDTHLQRRRSLLDDTELYQDALHSANHTLALGPTSGRVLFLTTTGFIGLAPHGTRAGDLIYIVLGASVPFALRPRPDSVGYELIGEAYVHGVMQGEALAMNNCTGFADLCIQ